jgi:integrase
MKSTCMPVYEYMVEWLESRRYALQLSTCNSYEMLINGRIKKYYSQTEITVASLRPADIRWFYTNLFQEGCSAATVIHYHAVLHKAFEQAYKEDIIPCNPFDKVDRPRVERYHANFLSEEDLATLLKNSKDDPMYAVIYLASIFGLRRSEVLGVRWSRIDFEQKRILFDTKVIEIKANGLAHVKPIEKMKNDSSRRYLPLPPNAEAVLLNIREKAKLFQVMFEDSYSTEYTDYVCCNPLGQLFFPRYVTNHFKVILRQNKLPDVRFHDLRHTCASILIQHQLPLIAVKEYLGHSDISTTANIYVHLEERSKRASALLMDAIYQPDGLRTPAGGAEHE